jgi:hypothetical protein
MELDQLDELKRWFITYSGRFFGSDDYVNFNLQVKREHTWRTCEEILYLAKGLSLDENQTRIAETVALLHDIGRFPQFVAYHTYNDSKSVNHGLLGVKSLHEEGALESLDRQEKLWIETAVLRHGDKSLPEKLNGEALLFLKLVRDADKLDIFRIVIQFYRNMKEDPGGTLLELPDEPHISPEALEAVMAGKPFDYSRLKTLNDLKLCQIGWIYDMNFAASLEKLESCNMLDEMFSFLPETPEIAEVRRKVQAYIASRKNKLPTKHAKDTKEDFVC